jgi:hypothetical protein
MTLRLGFIEEPHALAPQMVIWTSERPSWAQPDPDLESWPQQPLPPRQAS